jgi:glycosyltransferase involved in cell wall biosynthesis
VCCRNAATRIEDTLWSLVLQTADCNTYEIIVIDNASEDIEPLQSLVSKISAKAVQNIKLVEEPNTGLSHARNRAVNESTGEYIFFIDDDAVANARFVEHCIRAVEKHKPDVIGGNVLPLFHVQPPDELDYSCWAKWSLKHFGDSDRWLGDGEYFIGTSIGARQSLLKDNPFNPELGRKGETLMGGEEWFLGNSRFRRRFITGAYVFHKVPPERQSRNYFARRFLGRKRQEKKKIGFLHLLLESFQVVLAESGLAMRKISFQAALRLEIWRLSRGKF